MPIDGKRLGHNLKRRRLKLNMSQEDLARRADLKLSNVAKLEGGFNDNPTLSTLLALARVLTKGSIDLLIK